jgi:hypothetical protein
MSISIDPSAKRKSPVAKSVIGASSGKKVVDLSPKSELERRERDNKGVALAEEINKDEIFDFASAMVSSTGKPLYGGDPDLPFLLDKLMMYLTGEKNFNASVGSGARFGFLGLLARRLPRPILLDNEEFADELFPAGNKTFCVDPSGRMWIHAGFLKECIKLDQTEGLMTLPVLNHEHMHVALEHCLRMHNFDPRISNCAKDSVINPMVKTLYPAGTKFAKDFEGAWGNRPEDKRFEGLSEETIAKIMQSEAVANMQEKGTINIKLLEIVDGKVGQKTQLKAGKGETINLDHVVITVEEIFDAQGRSDSDKIDTDFDCATVVIDQTINRLKTRHRPHKKGGGKKSAGENVVEIPVGGNNQPGQEPDKGEGKDGKPGDQESPGNAEGKDGKPGDQNSPGNGEGQLSGRRMVNPNDVPGADGSGAFNQNAGHEVDMNKVKQVLKKHGYGDLCDNVVNPDGFSHENMGVLLQAAMTEAQLERARLGSYYPGSHVDEYIREIVKPSLKHSVRWQQRVQEFLAGAGPLMMRSIDEQSVLSLLDPEDLGMEEDELPFLPGLLAHKPEGRIAILVDSSGSMDEGRLVEAMSLIFGIRKTGNDLSPDIDIFSADTSLRGEPLELTEDNMDQFLQQGVEVKGRGGTDITAPLNQLCAYAEKNDIKYQAVLYITDFGLIPPSIDKLPEDLPACMFLGIPADYKASEDVVKKLRTWAEVVSIDKNMDLNMDGAESKANMRGKGLTV